MSLNEILAKNLLRFGAKNLTVESKSALLTEQTEPDLSQYDWSEGGTKVWDSADVGSIVRYIMARDAAQEYSNIEVYEPIFNWFVKHKTMPNVKDSLLVWCGDDPYYGLPNARQTAQASGTQYSNQNPEENTDLTALSNEWVSLIGTLKGIKSEDKQVAANLQVIATAFKKAAAAGLNVNTGKLTSPNTFKTAGYGTLKYLPNGGYTAEDVTTSKAFATSIVNRLSTQNKNTTVNAGAEGNLALVKANNINRTKLLLSINQKVQQKINNPQFRDSIAAGVDNVGYVVSKANYIEFSKQNIKTQTGTAEQPGSVDTVAVFDIQWPLKGEDQTVADNLAATFFPDDGTQTSSEAKSGMSQIAQMVRQEIQNQSQKYGETFEVISIAINTFASTSTVNSAYGSKNKKYNKQNNVTLVNARFAQMQADMSARLKEALGNNITDGQGQPVINKVIVGQRQNFANAGPEWESVGGDAYGQSYSIASYGPLFQEAYKANPKLTPKAFYSVEARKTNPQIKQDYEISFSGYRKAWIWLTVTMKGADAPDVQPLDVVISVSGDFAAEITWPDKRKSKPAKGSKSPRYSKPKNNMPSFGGRSIKCPTMF